ncbi:putative 2-dehydropantoate 2-reductase [Mastigocoleus testarum]|uniref:putative 2-dehydropantoate 2-reductase n=1 Tax=Mastigocoleus testarum TaxID=996925 RepID=UPI000409F632|nr:putative 2-dehydropantoate 2-reductase [Mastigocoleus testarum]
MTKNLTYAILGTGALGGFYGAKLQQAGLEVHFLVRSDYESVRRNGLFVESVDGDFRLNRVNAYCDVRNMPACDVAIVALKTTQNHLLPDILLPILKENSTVLVLQNGLGIEEEVAAIIDRYKVSGHKIGETKIIGGLCFLCSNKVGDGHIRHLAYGKINLGEHKNNSQHGGIADEMQIIANDFESAGIPIELSSDLLLARWKKLVWNIPYNGLSVVLDATTEELMTNPNSLELVKELMHEVLRGAKSVECDIPLEFIETMLEHTRNMHPYRTSMKIDYDEKRPLELTAIFSNALQAAFSRGVNLPKIRCLYQQLQFLDLRNRTNAVK